MILKFARRVSTNLIRGYQIIRESLDSNWSVYSFLIKPVFRRGEGMNFHHHVTSVRAEITPFLSLSLSLSLSLLFLEFLECFLFACHSV